MDLSDECEADSRRRSHLIIMAIIAAFTLYFFYANRRQRKGKMVIEGTVSLDLQIFQGRLLTVDTGRLSVYLLDIY